MEDRKADADTHLADARSQNTGNGISGECTKDEGSRESGCILFLEAAQEDEDEGKFKKID